jgi:hypothetical protein
MGGLINKELEKHVEESGHGLICGTTSTFA